MAEITLQAISPFSGLLARAAAHGRPAAPGLSVRERAGLGLATVLVRKGRLPELQQAAQSLWGMALRDEPAVSGDGRVAFVGISPGGWLAVSPGGGWRFARELAQRLQGLASVSDQSSGYGVLRLSGPAVRDVLAKGAPLDLHPREFPPGRSAVTDIAHVGGVLWRVDGTALAEPGDMPGGSFDVAVFRSLAGSFFHWLEESAEEFGLAVD